MARYHNQSLWEYLCFPVHLCFFIFVLLFVLGFSWYINYEYMFEDLMIQMKILLLLVPLLILVAVHWLSSGEPFPIPFPAEREALHRAGGSPWGVALVLVLLFLMISYQSSFHERWFPLGTR